MNCYAILINQTRYKSSFIATKEQSTTAPHVWVQRRSKPAYWRSLCLALLLTVPTVSWADNSSLVEIERPWLRAVPDTMDMTAVYMILKNTGSTPAELVGGSTSIAGSVAPMITTKEGQRPQTNARYEGR